MSSSKTAEVRLARLGSDPEWVFAKTDEWDYVVVPATEVITKNKALGLTTFIGLDGHASTAELRPPPAHNVRRHLYDVAYGVIATEGYLRQKPRFRSLRIVAIPIVGGETLGGHIHATFFVRDRVLRELTEEYNALPIGGDVIAYNPNFPPPAHHPMVAELLERYKERAHNDETISANLFARIVGYLLEPFERWVQPWHARVRRNRAYGANDDLIRYSYIPKPPIPEGKEREEWAWLHYEYRMPSTWLAHPWLAYSYLGLFKFALLNWDVLLSVATEDKRRDSTFLNNEPQNDRYWNVFIDRWNHVSKLRATKLTRDLSDLPAVFAFLREIREDMFRPFEGVNVKAWKSVLNN